MEKEKAKQRRRPKGMDLIDEDILQNILSKLPALSFASAACVNHSWNTVCNRILSRPKLSSALSLNASLRDATREVLDKVLSEPIRPHFAIAYVSPTFNLPQVQKLIVEKLGSRIPVITSLSSGIIGRDALTDEFKEVQWQVEDADDDAYVNLIPNPDSGIILTIGFLPGLKVNIVPLLKSDEDHRGHTIDRFVTDIRDYTASVSGCTSPVGIILFADSEDNMRPVLEKMDYAMAPETFIVGDEGSQFQYNVDCTTSTRRSQSSSSAAVALLFARESNKPTKIRERATKYGIMGVTHNSVVLDEIRGRDPEKCSYSFDHQGEGMGLIHYTEVSHHLEFPFYGAFRRLGSLPESNFLVAAFGFPSKSNIVALVFPGVGETQFHVAISTGLSTIGSVYKAVSVREKDDGYSTWLTARREGFQETLDGLTILQHIYDEVGDRSQYPAIYVGVTKRRKYSIGLDKVRWMTSQTFHEVLGGDQEYLFIDGTGVKTGDCFGFYHSDANVAAASCNSVSDNLRRLKQGCSNNQVQPRAGSIAPSGNKETFGCFIFSCCGRGVHFSGRPDMDSSPFLNNFPGVPLAGAFCGGEIGRGDLSSYCQEPQERRSVRCCLHVYSCVYLVMSHSLPLSQN